MSHNNVYILGHHKLTREPIYVASDNQLLTTFYTNSFDSPTAVGINGWYNEERPYQESELQELDVQEALRSPYISDYTRGLIAASSDNIFVTHTSRASLVSEMNMARFIPVDMVNFTPGTQAYESINFKPIKREGSLVHVKFPGTAPDQYGMYKDVTAYKIKKSVSGAYSLGDDKITIDLDKLRAFFTEFATEVGDLHGKLNSAISNLVRDRTQGTYLRYQERAKFDIEINNSFRVIKTDVMDDLAKFVTLLDLLDDSTSVVNIYYAVLEINRIQSSLDNRCIECGLKHMIRTMGTDLVGIISQASTPLSAHYVPSRQVVSVSPTALIDDVATVDAFIKGIKDACVSDSIPQEAHDVLDASAKLLAKLLAICKFVRYDLLTLAGYQYIIKT